MSPKTGIKAIVAISENYVIGKNGDLPWRISEDLKWFKKITLGHTLLMGRKTWESLPGPLPKRENWVLSSNLGEQPDIQVFSKLEEALVAGSDRELFIIGGGELYRQTLPLCGELYVSEVSREVVDGDAFFPPFKDKFEIMENLYKNDDFCLNRWTRKP